MDSDSFYYGALVLGSIFGHARSQNALCASGLALSYSWSKSLNFSAKTEVLLSQDDFDLAFKSPTLVSTSTSDPINQ